MVGQEGNERSYGVEPKSVVVQVDSVELGEVEDGGKEVGKRFGDLVEKSTGEDVGKVRNLTRDS